MLRSCALLCLAAWMLAACTSGDGNAAERLLVQYQCGSCHRIPGIRGAQGALGPPLEQFGRRSYIAGELPNTVPLLTRWLVEPQALVPGTAMPAMGLSAQDAQSIAAWLHAQR